MLFHKTTDFPIEYITSTAGGMTEAEVASLKELSVEVILITEEEKLLGVFGLIPHSMLSNEASIWAIFPDISLSSFKALRNGRKLFNQWVTKSNYRINAECWAFNKTAQKFARFMGFIPIKVVDEIVNMLYEGAT